MWNIPILKRPKIWGCALFDLNAAKFLDTTWELRRLKTLIQADVSDEILKEIVTDETAKKLAGSFNEMGLAAEAIGAEMTMIAANRFRDRLLSNEKK